MLTTLATIAVLFLILGACGWVIAGLFRHALRRERAWQQLDAAREAAARGLPRPPPGTHSHESPAIVVAVLVVLALGAWIHAETGAFSGVELRHLILPLVLVVLIGRTLRRWRQERAARRRLPPAITIADAPSDPLTRR